MHIEKEYYLDEFRKVLIISIGNDNVLILVDLYPCAVEITDSLETIHRIVMDDIEVLVKPLKLEDTTHFNRAEVEILCIRSKGICQYINLRLYTLYSTLIQFESRLFEVIHKIVDNIESCLKQ